MSQDKLSERLRADINECIKYPGKIHTEPWIKKLEGYVVEAEALERDQADPVAWMSDIGTTISAAEYKMWRDTTDERGANYMRTFTIPLYAHPPKEDAGSPAALGDAAQSSGPRQSGVPSSLRSDPASQAPNVAIAVVVAILGDIRRSIIAQHGQTGTKHHTNAALHSINAFIQKYQP